MHITARITFIHIIKHVGNRMPLQMLNCWTRYLLKWKQSALQQEKINEISLSILLLSMKGLHNPQALLERKVMSCFILVFKPMLLNLGTSVSCARYFSSVRRLKTGFCVTVTLEWFINQAMFNSQNKEKICWISLCFHLGFQPMKRRPIDVKGKCFKKTCSQSGSYPQV